MFSKFIITLSVFGILNTSSDVKSKKNFIYVKKVIDKDISLIEEKYLYNQPNIMDVIVQQPLCVSCFE